MDCQEDKQFKEIERSLASAKLPDLENCIHEQALRRALLRSDFFHENFFIRWSKRIWAGEKSIFSIAYVSFVSGILLAIVFQTTLLAPSEILKNFPVNAITSQEVQVQFVLQDLYKNGQLRLVGEDADGTRIYSLTMNDSTVKIYDKSPYTIDLVAAYK